MTPLWLSHFTATSSIGCGLEQTLAALRECRSGLAPCSFDTVDLATVIGEVTGVDAVSLPAHLADFDCRNNRLALLGLMQDGFDEAVRAAIARYGAQRVDVQTVIPYSGPRGSVTQALMETDAVPGGVFILFSLNEWGVRRGSAAGILRGAPPPTWYVQVRGARANALG